MARGDSKKSGTGTRLSEFLAEKAARPRPIYVLRGTDPYLLDQARQHVRRALAGFSDSGPAAAYQALVDADLEAKTTRNDRLVMETLIQRLCLPQVLGAGSPDCGSSG